MMVRRLLAFAGSACITGMAAVTVITVLAHRPAQGESQGLANDDAARQDAIPLLRTSSMHDIAMRQRESVDFLLSAPLLVRQAYIESGEVPVWPEP